MGTCKKNVLFVYPGVLMFLFLQVSYATDTISTNTPLSRFQTIVSSGDIFELGLFNPTPGIDGYFYVGMWYRKLSPRTIVWVANRESPVQKEASNCLLKISEGNLILHNNIAHKAIWSTGVNSSKSKDVQAVLLDSGNLVLRDGPTSSAAVLWQSFDHPSDTWLPGTKIRLGSQLLTSWKSSTDPSPGPYSLEVNRNTTLITVWNGSKSYWSSGPWDHGVKNFEGFPNLQGTNLIFELILDESYITYSVQGLPDKTYRLVMDVTGRFMLKVWYDDYQSWMVIWYHPENRCAIYNYCGSFAICNEKQELPPCRCVSGFERAYGEDSNDFSRGCERVNEHIELPVVLSSLAAAAAFFIGLYCCISTRRRRRKRTQRDEKQSRERLEGGIIDDDGENMCYLNLHDIMAATNAFSVENKLGEGGFGPVYKGKLPNGMDVAIKRLSKKSSQGLTEFKNEVVLIIKLQHKNLVRLLGYCVEGDEKLLIYEYMSNRSLDVLLFDSLKSKELDWETRMKIVNGTTRGLQYLHEDSRLRIIHRDLKASNILLDDEMNPKISDFGTARIFGCKQIDDSTQRIVGTFGYMSPEYALGGMISEKSDIYSYGVLLLEIISGKKATRFVHNDQKHSLVAYAWESWCETKGVSIIDEALHGSYSSKEVMRCVHIALLCVQDHPKDRPTVSKIVYMLSNDNSLPIPKQPTFSNVMNHQQLASNNVFSINEATQTELEPR